MRIDNCFVAVYFIWRDRLRRKVVLVHQDPSMTSPLHLYGDPHVSSTCSPSPGESSKPTIKPEFEAIKPEVEDPPSDQEDVGPSMLFPAAMKACKTESTSMPPPRDLPLLVARSKIRKETTKRINEEKVSSSIPDLGKCFIKSYFLQ